jgi:gamma-glutamyl:cysteine ligase YbdK (ATP-grasp superfamily)
VSDDARWTLRQGAFCGGHVHVGRPGPETAVAAFKGMRKWVPLLIALRANSRSGMAVSRGSPARARPAATACRALARRAAFATGARAGGYVGDRARTPLTHRGTPHWTTR